MILKIKYLYFISLFLLIPFCAQSQEGSVTISQDETIDKLIELKKDLKTTKLYRIQVYQSIDPDKATREKLNFLNLYNEWPVEIVWNTPNYKIWVGYFATRLEADRALIKIKKDYNNAIIFQPKFKKNK